MTLTQKLLDFCNLLFLFLCPIEANIGSEDSSLSDALVLDDGEFPSLALFPLIAVLFLIII